MKLTWKHILLAGTLFLVSAWWFHLISPNWWLPGVGLLLITTIWPPNLAIRLLCLTLLILTISRPLVNPYVRFELVLPNNFVGDFYLIEHPSGDGHLQLSGLWKTTVTMRVPESGMLIVRDKTAFHYWRNDEVWHYEDGRVIRRWPNRLEPPFVYADMGGDRAGGVPDSSPLAPYRGKYQTVHFVKGTIKTE